MTLNAPFTTDTPTAVLVRQVLGAVSQFEKANLVAKLRAARERKVAAGGRGSGRFTYAQKVPEVVALVRELHGQRQSLRMPFPHRWPWMSLRSSKG